MWSRRSFIQSTISAGATALSESVFDGRFLAGQKGSAAQGNSNRLTELGISEAADLLRRKRVSAVAERVNDFETPAERI